MDRSDTYKMAKVLHEALISDDSIDNRRKVEAKATRTVLRYVNDKVRFSPNKFLNTVFGKR